MRTSVFLLLAYVMAWTQAKHSLPSASPNTPPHILWQPLSRAAGIIFSGVVLQVERPANSTSTTQITFRVEQGLRGVRAGQVIRIREWGGLWNTGERYTKGERVLLFLYPRNKLGLTSPIGGRVGRFAVDSAGRVLVADPQQLRQPRPVPLKIVKAQISRALQE